MDEDKAVDQKLLNELTARRCLDEVKKVLEKHGCMLLPTITLIGSEQTAGMVCRVRPEGNNSSQKETIIPPDGEAG